jgi:hypothetical protein
VLVATAFLVKGKKDGFERTDFRRTKAIKVRNLAGV